MKELLKKIGNMFSGLFNTAKRTYEKLPDEVKKAAVWSSGVIDIINNNLTMVSKDLMPLIQKQYPEINVQQLQDTIKTIAVNLKLVSDGQSADYEACLAAIQKYLNGLDGAFWAGASKYLACIGTIIFSPMPIKIEAVSSIMGYVYHDLIKK